MVLRARSSARSSPGAPTMRVLSWLRAQIRASPRPGRWPTAPAGPRGPRAGAARPGDPGPAPRRRSCPPLDRRAPAARHLGAGEVDEPLVAACISGNRNPPEQPTDRGDGRCGQRVAMGVDADDTVHMVSQHSHGCSSLFRLDRPVPAWRNTARRTCDESRHRCRTGCCIRPEAVVPGRRRHPADNSSPRQTSVPLIRCGSCRSRRRSLTAILSACDLTFGRAGLAADRVGGRAG
jgi:hypothetical protein